MIRLDLSAGPQWLDLGAGLRLHVLPVTTAIMVVVAVWESLSLRVKPEA